MRQAQGIRMKLGGSGSMADTFPDKSKGMHWHTYEQLYREAEEASDRSWPPWVFRMLASRK